MKSTSVANGEKRHVITANFKPVQILHASKVKKQAHLAFSRYTATIISPTPRLRKKPLVKHKFLDVVKGDGGGGDSFFGSFTQH